jgi:hypothetical protein
MERKLSFQMKINYISVSLSEGVRVEFLNISLSPCDRLIDKISPNKNIEGGSKI